MHSITIDETSYELQSLTAGQLRREASAKLSAIEDLSRKLNAGEITAGHALPDLVGNASDIVLLSLHNKYPEITLDQIDSLSFADLRTALEGVCEISGMKG
jgi:hypothetical protein